MTLGLPPLPRPLEISQYLDPAVYEVECREIFTKEWIAIGFEAPQTDIGTTISETIGTVPVFVQRGSDGELRGFVNVCPHRGGPIVDGSWGCRGNLVCRYHGWAFGEDGSLLSARDYGGELPEGIGLRQIAVDTWRGIVFVNLAEDPKPLIDSLGSFPGACEAIPWEHMAFHSRTTRQVRCNWKVYAENFLENYHIPTTHPALARETDATKFRQRTFGDRRWNIHRAPAKENAPMSGVFGYFWPNFSFDLFPGGFATERWFPRGHDGIDLYFDYFFDKGANDVDAMVKVSEQVADEDAHMCELVQSNLASGEYVPGWLSPRHENTIADFHDLLRDAYSIGGPAVPGTPYPWSDD